MKTKIFKILKVKIAFLTIWFLLALPVKAITDSHLRIDSFLTDGVFVVPAGVTSVTFEGWGAGGTNGTDGTMNGAGGGGAYMKTTIPVSEGQEYSIVVGQGHPELNGNGGDSSVSLGETVYLLAKGGKGGGSNGSYGGLASEGVGDIGFNGGDGARAEGSASKWGGSGAGDKEDSLWFYLPYPPGDSFGGAGFARKLYGAGGNALLGQINKGTEGIVRATYSITVEDFPVVKSRNWGRTKASSTNHPINMPLGIQEGELLIIAFSGPQGEHDIVSDDSVDWVKLISTTSGSITGSIFYKIAEGNDTATVVSSANAGSAHISFRIAAAGIPTVSSFANTGTNPNPPLHDTGAESNYLWLTAITRKGSSIFSNGVNGMPANYKDFLYLSGIGAVDPEISVAGRHLESHEEDPGSFTAISSPYVAFTLAVPYQKPLMVASSADDLTIREAQSKTFEISLDRKPDNDVIVDFDYDSDDLILNKDTLTFTTLNWMDPQTVTVTALNDGLEIQERQANITLLVSSLDNNYNNFEAEDITVTIQNNRAATISIVAPLSGAVVSEKIEIQINVDDDYETLGVQLKLDDQVWGPEYPPDSWPLLWDTAEIADGDYLLTAVARDDGGSYSTSSAVALTVRNDVLARQISGGGRIRKKEKLQAPLPVSSTTQQTIMAYPRDLKLGLLGDDVLRLQVFLNGQGFPVASTGPGSSGQETTYFGPATQAALIRYQQANKIVPAVGYFGSITQTQVYLTEAGLSKSDPDLRLIGSMSGSSSPHHFATTLFFGLNHPDVRELQQFLNNDPDTLITKTGPGSPNQETLYFGQLTLDAVRRFQRKYNLARPQDPGYGRVGPLTRAKLNELAGW
ncbi:MAG TPA: peptidoglycan-binding protein [Candidatus Paceibacterota bacterium]|nr:peptidoglycan-binding protein [Candidatus Paceibacterota bacterium]HPN89383.1 peptidoglycan-binding protein [Candidatus Paceibacterota bacterium]HPY13115.1 peptidoglycan-binding protein [Candidatus Paceibacterota bacterium]HQB26963.1 peptidoglycan-binding protein [Candidatus Paceibacterota bacterium]